MYGKTDKKELSRMYFVACSGIHDTVNSLYEHLHLSNGGDPKIDEGYVADLITRAKRSIFIELDLIKTALAEYNEENEPE